MDPLIPQAQSAYDLALDTLSRYAVREDAEGYANAFAAVSQARRDLESLGVIAMESKRTFAGIFRSLPLSRMGRTREIRSKISAKRALDLATDRPCGICGAMFRPTQTCGRLAILCSDRCRTVNKARHSKKHREELQGVQRNR